MRRYTVRFILKLRTPDDDADDADDEPAVVIRLEIYEERAVQSTSQSDL